MYRQIALLAITTAFIAHESFAQIRSLDADRSSRRVNQPIRGATLGPIECPDKPCGYGTRDSEKVLDELKRVGVNWIALTPFGRLWDLDSTRIRHDFEAPFEQTKAGVIRMVQQAHQRGMSVLIIPHIFIESSGLKGDQPGHWRGETRGASKTHWARYHRSYENFVMAWAEIAQAAQADAFSIGAECTSWSGRFGDVWVRLIKNVRSRFSGLLTYSANWYEEADYVLFWDLLDFIGINAFYDLAEHGGASTATYRASAERHVETVRKLAVVTEKPIVFMELGFTARPDSGVRPWKWPENADGPAKVDVEEQRRGYEVMTDAFLKEPWFNGFFVWRYPASLTDLQEPAWGFSPLDKPAHQLLETIFHRQWASDLKVRDNYHVK